MNGYAVAMFRLLAITASTQVVGNDTVIIRQAIGEGLETECVGGYTRYTDNWSSVLNSSSTGFIGIRGSLLLK